MQAAGQPIDRIVFAWPVTDPGAQLLQRLPPGVSGRGWHAQALSQQCREVVDAALVLVPHYPLHQREGEGQIGESAAEWLCRIHPTEKMHGADAQRRPGSWEIDAVPGPGAQEEAVAGLEVTVARGLTEDAVPIEHCPEIPVRKREIVQPTLAAIDEMGPNYLQISGSHVMKVQNCVKIGR